MLYFGNRGGYFFQFFNVLLLFAGSYICNSRNSSIVYQRLYIKSQKFIFKNILFV